jgi:hypothetical protein
LLANSRDADSDLKSANKKTLDEKVTEVGMKTWEAVFTVMATCLGAGIVFVPYQVLQTGVFWSCVIFVVAGCIN